MLDFLDQMVHRLLPPSSLGVWTPLGRPGKQSVKDSPTSLELGRCNRCVGMKVRPPWWWTPGSKLTFLKPPSPAEASEVTKPVLASGEPAQQAVRFQEEWVVAGF